MYNKMLTGSLFILAIMATTAYKTVNTQSAQKGGLYMTLEDFSSHKLTALKSGEKYIPDKRKIYGYQGNDNRSYRLYNKDAYQIMDTEGFFLYYRYVYEAYTKGKGEVKMDKYYFSRVGSSDIQLLTIENLKSAFPDNHRFHYAIDGLFRTNRELMAYDSFSKCYKLKYIYSQSLK
jgi:hypothetical protein